MRYAIALALVLFSCAAIAAEPVTIPLKDVWAYQMPGTMDVRELEPNVYGKDAQKLSVDERQRGYESSLIKQIVVHLADESSEKVSRPGFAVAGIGLEALRAAHAVIVKNEKPKALPADGDTSLVFFTREFNYYVHITEIEHKGDTFKIQFRFVPHNSKDATVHFALIPVGKLAPGKYSVQITQGPDPIKPEWERRIVCQPFPFTVDR